MASIVRRRRAQVAATSAVAMVATLGLGVPTVGAVTPAQKTPLTQTNRNCDGTVIGGTQTESFGFAVVTRPATDKLIAAVALKGATPSATFNIRLIQVVPGDTDCHIVDGTLTTDALGNGNANVQEPVLSGATSYWVDLNQQGPDNFYDTEPVLLSPSG